MEFKVIKITSIKDILEGKDDRIPESDIMIQTPENIIQYVQLPTDEDRPKFIIKPGCFSFSSDYDNLELTPFELREHELCLNIDNTKLISLEMDRFFSKLEIYKSLNRTPKRSLLLCSLPGVGKTSTISKITKEYLNKDEGTTVIIWDTSEFSPTKVNSFFSQYSSFDQNVSKLILIIEDIEGGAHDSSRSGQLSTSSSMLNFLDGVGDPFKGIPTFIIATTNNPEKSVGALIDRPGRFDKVLELKTPSPKETIELLKFISKKDELSDEDIEAAKLASKNEFSIAHIQEVVVRSIIDEKSFLEVVNELIEHKKRFKNAFINAPIRKVGLSGDPWDDL